jgi:glycosyltransferase involved in cell wall biosynthesis
MMRVGVQLPVIPERPAGVGRYAQEVLSRLAVRNLTLVPMAQRVEVTPNWAGSDFIRIPGDLRLGLASGLVRRVVRLTWGASGHSVARLQDRGIDVIYGVAQEGPTIYAGPPVCLVVHDLIPLRTQDGRRIDAILLRTAFRRMLRRASSIIAVSCSTRDDLCDLLGIDSAQITVIPSGVDHGRFFPQPKSAQDRFRRLHGLSENSIVHVGTLAPHKRVDLLVRALGQSPLRGSDARLALVGPLDGRQLEKLYTIARAEGVADRVDAIGYVDANELPTVLSAARVVCQASHTEGFGLAAVESMACGAPVVVSSTAALVESVGDAGLIVDEADPLAWSAAIDKALGPDNAQLSRRSVQRAAQFDWNTCADQTAEMLADTARGAFL